MPTSYSEYENTNRILLFRTSNLGLVTLDPVTLPPSADIFSYIDNNGIRIIDISTLNDTLSEEALMGGIIFNTNITKIGTKIAANVNAGIDSISSEDRNNISASIRYILDSTKHFNIGDFSFNIKYNSVYYNDGFNFVDLYDQNAASINTDIDTSYYASQNIIKYLFLLDTLSEIYRIVNENKTTKSGITNIFNFFDIRCRYIIDANGIWKLYKPANPTDNYWYTISFADTLNSQTPIITIKSTSLSNKDVVNNMIRPFNAILVKHFNYIKKADMIYADNFRNFYRLCRIMLNYNILYSLRLLIAYNSYAIQDKTNSVLTYNNDCTDDIHFETTRLLTAPLLHEKYYNHIMPSCIKANYASSFSIDVILQGEDPLTKRIGVLNTQDVTSLASYNNISQQITEQDSKVIYRIISTNQNKDNALQYRSKPIGKVFTYAPKILSDITFTYNANNTIKTISGLIPNRTYYIKLHNFSTIGCQSFSSDKKYSWNNDTKILEILKENVLASIDFDVKDKLYLIEFSSSKQITYPSDFNNSTVSILFTTINSTDRTSLNSSPYSSSNNNLVTVTFDDVLNTRPIVLASESINSYHFYTKQDKIASLNYILLSDNDVFKLIYYNKDIFKINMDIVTNNTIGILPCSFETYNYQVGKTAPVDFLQNFYLPTLTNFKIQVANTFVDDIKDNDTIIRTMSNLASVNEKISKNSTVVKTNYNNFKKEHTKVVSSNTVDIIAIILFVITLFVALFIPNSSFNKNTSLLVSGGLFLVVLLVFIIIYSIIYTRYTELFDIFDESEGVLSYKTEVNDIISALVRNMYNERTRISEKVILPSLIKENKYFQEKNDRMNIHKTTSNGDLQIERMSRKKNVARITYLLNITLIIATALVIYVVAPNQWKIILGVAVLLILFCLFIYYEQIVTVVHTNSANQYWAKPKVSLANLDNVNVSTT